MDYEKAYKDALERAKKLLLGNEHSNTIRSYFEHIFPELAESEDERIRKRLLKYFQDFRPVCDNEFLPPFTIDDILAYLEKQKEKKFDFELIKQAWYMEGYKDREFGKESKWIVKTGEGGPEYELNPKYGQKLVQDQKPSGDKYQQELKATDRWQEGYEAGYNAASKPAEWSEKRIADIFEKVGLAKIVREQGNDALTNAVQSAMIELRKVENTEWSEEKKVLDYLIEFIYRSDEDIFPERGGVSKLDILTYLEKQKWQKPAWSEEDSVHLANAILSAEEKWGTESCTAKWLKSLRPSWKPSEEQMRDLEGTIKYYGS